MLCFLDATSTLVAFLVCQVQARIVVNNKDQELTAVPQNVDVNVGHFILKQNDIEVIHNLSFPRYTKMEILNLDQNPLRIIGENTFAQNEYLWKFHCMGCKIQSLPVNFGSCVPNLRIMHLYSGFNSKFVPAIFKPPYFEAFTSLHFIGMMHLPLKNVDNLKLPPSMRHFIMAYAGLTAFPNLTSSAYPVIAFIDINRNGLKSKLSRMIFGNTCQIPCIHWESLTMGFLRW